MKILLSNDDGFEAEGILALKRSLEKEHDVTIVAPDRERSSSGHALTISKLIRVTKLEDKVYKTTGTPADCIFFALGELFKENKPDLIITGINNGANLGQDRFYSGTMAAAREGLFRGVRSIATSLVTNSSEQDYHFEDASLFIKSLIHSDLLSSIPDKYLLNINIPNKKKSQIMGVELTSLGYQLYSDEVLKRTDHRGKDYYWLGGNYLGFKDIKGSDCEAVSQNKISLTLENLEGNVLMNDEKILRIIKDIT